MPNRTTKFVSALFASLLAGAPLTTASHSAPAPAEAEKCLAGPKGTPPQGGHWYYRVERATKRHCWYIGDEKEKVARAAPANSSASADSASPASPPKNAATQRTIADARAELPLPQMQVEPESSITGQRAVAPAANTAGTDTNQRANVWDTNTQSSVISSRWTSAAPSAKSESTKTRLENTSAIAATANHATFAAWASDSVPACAGRTTRSIRCPARYGGTRLTSVITVAAAIPSVNCRR